MQQTVALMQQSLDSLHLSTAAYLKAGSGIAQLTQNHLRSMLEFARRNTDIGQHTAPQELTRRLFDDELHSTSRDTCLHVAGQMMEAQATLFDAAKSVVDCSHAWLLGCIAEAYPRSLPVPAEAVAETLDDSAAAPRSRRRSGQ